jgi:hypothetical protein
MAHNATSELTAAGTSPTRTQAHHRGAGEFPSLTVARGFSLRDDAQHGRSEFDASRTSATHRPPARRRFGRALSAAF